VIRGLSVVPDRHAFVLMTVGAQPGKLEVPCMINMVHCLPASSKYTLPMLCSYIRSLGTKMPLKHGSHLSDVRIYASDRTSVIKNFCREYVSILVSRE
jgi:hypothetical protein